MKIALLGNPNTGKSSIFNLLTGLRQHVGNFPGVTVDKKTGSLTIDSVQHELIDFPGTYSIYPHSKDEEVVYSILSDKNHKDYPDLALVVVDASNLRRNLFLFSQVYDLGIPTIMVMNMSDVATRKGISLNQEQLQNAFPAATIVSSNARVGLGKERILEAIKEKELIEHDTFLLNAGLADSTDIASQEAEAEQRYAKINELVKVVEVERKVKTEDSFTNKLDRILIHPIFGYLIFAAILLVIFQFIFSFATIPMDLIDGAFAQLADWTSATLPSGVFTELLSEGIISGIGGVVIFIPQIALLFFFIAILEESGYLARVVFIMDRLMRPFGLNGKSVVPLMSSVACAIPGVMATRTIADWKERMITILVAPLMSCSARIPVYTLLIALVIPETTVGGIFNLQGLVLFALYSLGVIAALFIAIILKWLIRTKEKGFLLLELPSYKTPRWGNVGITVLEKVKVFVLDAGKIILAISIVLWFLASYGPSNSMEEASKNAEKFAIELNLDEDATNDLVSSVKLEKSYIGIMGKTIEPVIQPLGYDWKMGISLITSFAAREVFVGTLATIYAVHDDGEENQPLIEKLRNEQTAEGKPVYNLASGLSLMVFYVFAMQCMATLAVVKRETKSWKWPLIQIGYMGVLAYIGAYITFTLFS